MDLLRTFVREDWVKDIDENSLVRIDKSYILQDFSQKEADIVYRLKIKGSEAIFYILLELQSTVDYLMPFRLLLYMTEIWRDIYNNTSANERERKGFRLPAIIPAVLYNGANNWTAARNFKEILAEYQRFEKHLLDFQYILFDVNRYDLEELYQAAGLIASIFALEQKTALEEIMQRLQRLAETLQNLGPERFQQFKKWFLHVLKTRLEEPLQEKVEKIIEESTPWEVEKMISNLGLALAELKQKAEMEGMLKGRTEGRMEGRIEGRMEGKKEVARAALKKGFRFEDIAEITGLSLEEVLEIQKEMEQ